MNELGIFNLRLKDEDAQLLKQTVEARNSDFAGSLYHKPIGIEIGPKLVLYSGPFRDIQLQGEGLRVEDIFWLGYEARGLVELP